MNLRRLAIAPAFAVMASTLIFAGSAPSSADAGHPFDIVGMDVADIRVNSSGCRNVSMNLYLAHDGTPIEDASADVEIWRGGRYLSSEYLSYAPSTMGISGSYFYCPNLDGVGSFRAGPSEVHYATYDYEEIGDFRDETTGKFTILQDARVTKLKAKRKGKKVTFTGRSSWYSINGSRWVTDPKGWKLRLQRQSGSKWKTVKNFRAGKKGFIVKTSRSARAKYRVVSAAGRDTWSGVSKTVRK